MVSGTRVLFLILLVISGADCAKRRKSSDKNDPIPSTTESPTSSNPSPTTSPTNNTSGVPRYPIVLVYGFGSTDKVGNFVGIEADLTARGMRVLAARLPAIGTIAERGSALALQIDTFLQATGASKVNIIAHSMGGLDARYVISTMKYSNRVASLSTISTPHRGTAVADKFSEDSLTGALSGLVEKYFGTLMGTLSETSLNKLREGLSQLSTTYITQTFNPANPDDAGVYYQSWAAHSGTGSGDRLKVVLYYTHSIVSKAQGANDGMVAVSSAIWGNFRSDLVADHWDLIGYHNLDKSGSPFNHTIFYQDLVKDLAQRGL